MIKKHEHQDAEDRVKMRGGTGTVTIRHYFTPQEIMAPCRLCAELIVPPGASIGEHEHSEEDEVYIVQAGTGVIIDNGRELPIAPGDAILTGNGDRHAIRNTGTTDLRVIAVIMKYS